MTLGWRIGNECVADIPAAKEAVISMYPKFLMIDTSSIYYTFTAYGSTVTQLTGPADALVLRINPATNYVGTGTPSRNFHTYVFPQCVIEDFQGSSMAAYDYVQGAAIWGFFFSFTVALWLVAKNAGLVINFIKRH